MRMRSEYYRKLIQLENLQEYVTKVKGMISGVAQRRVVQRWVWRYGRRTLTFLVGQQRSSNSKKVILSKEKEKDRAITMDRANSWFCSVPSRTLELIGVELHFVSLPNLYWGQELELSSLSSNTIVFVENIQVQSGQKVLESHIICQYRRHCLVGNSIYCSSLTV